ncbi:MAG: hypothetical protein ACMXYE_03935, partial [Candidatus Woesearchaeota archaeon]
MDFSNIETTLRNIARRYQNALLDTDDLVSIGKVAIWQSYEEGMPRSHMILRAKSAMSAESRKQKAMKRTPPQGISSIQAPITEEGQTLEDVIKSEDAINLDEDVFVSDEQKGFIYTHLRKKYGGWWIHKIQKQDNARKIVREIVRYLFEDIHKASIDEIPKLATDDFFKEHKLSWFLWIFYNGSPREAVMDAYKGEVMPWDFTHVPRGFWSGKLGERRARDALEWFCAKRGISSIEDCKYVTNNDFAEEGLAGLLYKRFNSSSFLALKAIFPSLERKDKIYQKNVYTTPEEIKEAVVEYLIGIGVGNLEGLTISETYDSGLRDNFKAVQFRKAYPSIVKRHKFSSYNVLKATFPEQIEPWCVSGPHTGWRNEPRETAARAIRWLFEDYLQIPIEEIPSYATQQF